MTFGETPIRITEIQLSDPILITAPLHGLSNGATVKLANIGEDDASTLNGTTWTIANVAENTFELDAQVE